MPMLASGLALLESVANQQKRLSELPNFNVFDNLGEIMVIFFALFGSMLPEYWWEVSLVSPEGRRG